MSEDETRRHDPPADPPSSDPDATQAAGPPTKAQPPAEPQPAGPPAGDETVVVPKATGPGGTGVLPAVGAEPPRWSARAQVRPPSVDDEIAPDWEEGVAAPGRGLLAPILISVGAVVLLGLIVIAVVLLMRQPNEPLPPAPTATATATTASPTPSPTPEATTPPATSALPTSLGPQPVEIPAVIGMDFDTAAAALRGLGLQVRRVDQSSATVPAGQVVDTEPPPGTLALPGLVVDVIVSTGPEQPPTTTTTTTTPPED